MSLGNREERGLVFGRFAGAGLAGRFWLWGFRLLRGNWFGEEGGLDENGDCGRAVVGVGDGNCTRSRGSGDGGLGR